MLCIWCPLQSIPRLGTSKSSTTLPAPSNPQPSTQVTVARQRSLETLPLSLSRSLALSDLSLALSLSAHATQRLKAAILNTFAELYLCGAGVVEWAGELPRRLATQTSSLCRLYFRNSTAYRFSFSGSRISCTPNQMRRPHSAAAWAKLKPPGP